MPNNAAQQEEFLDDVDSAAVDAIEQVRDGLLKQFQLALLEQSKPSVLFKPVLSKTATAWKVVYGEFTVFGATPDTAMKNFDNAWIRRGINAN